MLLILTKTFVNLKHLIKTSTCSKNIKSFNKTQRLISFLTSQRSNKMSSTITGLCKCLLYRITKMTNDKRQSDEEPIPITLTYIVCYIVRYSVFVHQIRSAQSDFFCLVGCCGAQSRFHLGHQGILLMKIRCGVAVIVIGRHNCYCDLYRRKLLLIEIVTETAHLIVGHRIQALRSLRIQINKSIEISGNGNVHI